MCKMKNAAAGTAARQIKLRPLKYSTNFNLSTAKIKIPKIFLGEALLFGNRESKKFWPAFEVLLRRAI